MIIVNLQSCGSNFFVSIFLPGGGGVQSQFSVALLFEFNNFEFQTPIIMKMSLIDLNILIKRDKYCAI